MEGGTEALAGRSRCEAERVEGAVGDFSLLPSRRPCAGQIDEGGDASHPPFFLPAWQVLHGVAVIAHPVLGSVRAVRQVVALGEQRREAHQRTAPLRSAAQRRAARRSSAQRSSVQRTAHGTWRSRTPTVSVDDYDQ